MSLTCTPTEASTALHTSTPHNTWRSAGCTLFASWRDRLTHAGPYRLPEGALSRKKPAEIYSEL